MIRKTLLLLSNFSCIKCLQLSRLKAKCYRHFISIKISKLIRENCDEFLSFILNALFYIVILIYFSLHAMFSLTLKTFSHIFSFIYTFCNHKVLTFLSLLTFLFTILNNSPYSMHVYNFCIVSFHVIRPTQGLCGKQGFTNSLIILPNCSISVTVAVDKYVNNSIYLFGFYDFLWFTLDLCIPEPLKSRMTSGSIESIETTNFLFLWISFLFLFFMYS